MMVFEYDIYRCTVDADGYRLWFTKATDKFGAAYWRETSDDEFIEDNILREIFSDSPPTITQVYGVEVSK